MIDEIVKKANVEPLWNTFVSELALFRDKIGGMMFTEALDRYGLLYNLKQVIVDKCMAACSEGLITDEELENVRNKILSMVDEAKNMINRRFRRR